jgi:glycosyltransferase involved in cell wall biosynthesis
MQVSVIIPCFNAQRWIRQTLQSAITQRLDNIEIIVIDDGSTDESANIVEKEFPSVHLIRTSNKGASKARNLGTEISKGEFIQYLDADDLLAPDKLKIQVEALKDSGADVAYGNWQEFREMPGGNFVKAKEFRRKMRTPQIDLFTDFWCPPAVYLFRRSIVEKVGGWNEKLPIIQDARFALDCALRGARFAYCEGLTAYYRVHYKDSLSQRDSIGFSRDCLQNAVEVEEWWQGHEGINEERKNALLRVYGYIAREAFKKDKPTSEYAYMAINKLAPAYIPFGNKFLRLVCRHMGYRTAALISFWYRRIINITFAFINRDSNCYR